MIIYDALHRSLKPGDLVILPQVVSPVCRVVSVAPSMDPRAGGGMRVIFQFTAQRIVPMNSALPDILLVQAAPDAPGVQAQGEAPALVLTDLEKVEAPREVPGETGSGDS